jgi:hypothetical protein
MCIRPRTLLLGLALAACGDDKPGAIDAALPKDAAVDAKLVDAAPEPRGPATIELAGGANGLLWDNARSTLYLTDSNANKLLTYTDANRIQEVGTFPPATAGVSLGDLVKRNNGSILTPSFGFGTQGTLFTMAPDGTSASITGLDVARRRIGLAAAGNTFYVTYFVGGGGGSQTGGVATLTISGGTNATETEIAGGTTSAGFKKLVGIVATPSALFVSDQSQNKIFKIALPDHTVSELATVPSADLMTLMPNGDLLTGGTGVHRITQAGVVSTIMTGFEQVRGLAYDPTLRRLFIIEHSATVGTPDKLHVRPLDE